MIHPRRMGQHELVFAVVLDVGADSKFSSVQTSSPLRRLRRSVLCPVITVMFLSAVCVCVISVSF